MTDTYRIRSPETWDRAREAYLAGETAESVCSRFDLGLRAFADRAKAGGWRRADQPDPEPFEIEDDADLDDEVSDAELRRLARARMARAARQGLVGEALRWARLCEHIDRQAQAEARRRRDLAAADRSIVASVKSVMGADRAAQVLHDLHGLHPVSEGADEAAPLNRSDRRRLLKSGRKRR